jgi:hypothetical protein
MNTWVAPSKLPEHTLWTMRKGHSVAEARVRLLAVGLELRFFIRTDGAEHSSDGLYHSQIYRPQEGGTPALYDAALLKRREFEVRGWQLET